MFAENEKIKLKENKCWKNISRRLFFAPSDDCYDQFLLLLCVCGERLSSASHRTINWKSDDKVINFLLEPFDFIL